MPHGKSSALGNLWKEKRSSLSGESRMSSELDFLSQLLLEMFKASVLNPVESLQVRRDRYPFPNNYVVMRANGDSGSEFDEWVRFCRIADVVDSEPAIAYFRQILTLFASARPERCASWKSDSGCPE